MDNMQRPEPSASPESPPPPDPATRVDDAAAASSGGSSWLESSLGGLAVGVMVAIGSVVGAVALTYDGCSQGEILCSVGLAYFVAALIVGIPVFLVSSVAAGWLIRRSQGSSSLRLREVVAVVAGALAMLGLWVIYLF